MAVRKQPTGAEAQATSLKLWRQYVTEAKVCDHCGEPLGDPQTGETYRVTMLVVEMRDEFPVLLARQTVCDECAAALPQFQLPNSLYRAGVMTPPTPLPLEIERSEEREEAERAARKLQQEGGRLEKLLQAAGSPAERQKLRKAMDQLVTAMLGPDQSEPGLGSMKFDRYGDADENIPAPPSRMDLRLSVLRFLQSPYANTLPHSLHRAADLYAAGHTEEQIAKELGIPQATVSRRIKHILQVARRRH